MVGIPEWLITIGGYPMITTLDKMWLITTPDLPLSLLWLEPLCHLTTSSMYSPFVICHYEDFGSKIPEATFEVSTVSPPHAP